MAVSKNAFTVVLGAHQGKDSGDDERPVLPRRRGPPQRRGISPDTGKKSLMLSP
jgi:hypothetical protein